MSIVDKYLTQTAYVLEQLGTNRYGEYETVSKPIKCRLEMSQSYLGEITRALMITDYQLYNARNRDKGTPSARKFGLSISVNNW